MLGRRQLSALLLPVLIGTLAACTTPATPSSTTPTGDASSSAVPAEVTAALASAAQEPTFTAPGPAFDASKARGKTIMSIPITSQIPYIVAVDKVQEQIAGQLGVKWIECTNQGAVPEWVNCMNQAIAQKVDLINLSQLPNPANLQPQIKAARAAGIDVISTHGPDPETYPPGTVPEAGTANLTSYVVGPFVQVAQLQADFAISDSGGKANALIVAPPEVLSAPGHVQAIKDEFAKHCPGCKVSVLEVPIADWATKLVPQMQASLTKDPGIDYMLPIYDGMVSFANSAITSSGRRGQIKIATYNGNPDVLSAMLKSDTVAMDLGESVAWLAMADLDTQLRILSGVEPIKDQKTPVRMYTKDNVAAAGTPPTFDGGFGDSYVSGYSALWGLSTPVTVERN